MLRKLSALLLVLPLLGVLAACEDDDPSGPGGALPISITILTPNNGDSVTPGPLFIQVRTEGILMDCAAIGGTHVPGHGHWHAYVDGTYYGASCTDNITIDVSGLASGKHALVASLRQNDHDPYLQYPPNDPFTGLDTDDIISIVVP